MPMPTQRDNVCIISLARSLSLSLSLPHLSSHAADLQLDAHGDFGTPAVLCQDSLVSLTDEFCIYDRSSEINV